MAKQESDEETNSNSKEIPPIDINENMSEGSDNSDSDSDDEEEKLKQQAEELQKHIEENKYSYDDYVNLLELLQKMGELTEMRKVYKEFSDIFPLTTSLWLGWINVEVSIATSENEKKSIGHLFEKAVQDYLSVDLWLEYIKFYLDNFSVDEIRSVFEKALTAGGLHVAKGSLLWDSYREFELAHLAALQSKTPGSFDDTWLLQAQRVSNIYKRQLSTPLFDMDKTFIEFRVWAERLPRKDFINLSEFEAIYKKASEKLNDIYQFEEKLLVGISDNEKLEVYNEYLDYEKSNPVRLNILYERAVCDIPLNAELWLRYCKFASQLGPESFALPVCHRSVRNCMWTVELWIHYLITQELFQRPQGEVTEIFEKSLQNCYSAPAHKQLWLFYLEYSRRKFTDGTLGNDDKMEEDSSTSTYDKNDKAVKHLRSLFSQAHEFVINTWGLEGDPGHTILQFWARFEATICHNFEEARKLWRDILSTGNKEYAFVWLEYLKLELRYGDPKHIRKSFLRAVQSTKDWPNVIAEAWLNYERDYGTLESLLECQDKCKGHLETWTKNQIVQESYDEQAPKKKNTPENKSYSEQRKRKSFNDAAGSNNVKKVKQYHKELESLSELRMEEDNPDNKQQHEFKEPVAMDAETESRTLFISNLDYNVNDDDLKTFFGNVVKSIRLVKDYKGRSKGYAYLELNSKDEADATLKRDRDRLLGRPVFVSRCKTEKVTREKVFKYSTKREQHKLFIKNLPLSLTQEQLESIFSPYGKIKDTRMVCYRNGHFKGLAYVEFENAADAARAVLKCDGQIVDNQAISVAISDPPVRQQKDRPESSTSKEPMLRKSRLQVPLLPTILQRAAQGEESSDMKPKSNEDFRQMLLRGGT